MGDASPVTSQSPAEPLREALAASCQGGRMVATRDGSGMFLPEGPILPYFSSLPLDDMVAICSSEVLPHRLLLMMVLSALFSFFFFPMYAWILLE